MTRFTVEAAPESPSTFSMDPDAAPTLWSEWSWDALLPWVPVEVRRPIESFWAASYNRSPREWLRDARIQGTPPIGAWCTSDRSDGGHVGRWIHCWNNIGRLVDIFGRTHFASTVGLRWER
jgi:hypothetical protein